MHQSIILAIVAFATLTFVICDDGNADEVQSLPGLNSKINFRHYSGYLSALNGTFLHYWFFESQNNPAKDPVVLWLNGGPGCSSLLGALTENGPISLKRDGTLSLNPYAWNKKASLIYIESPAGVGFSYNIEDQYATNDDLTADNNFAALKSFFAKFPHLKNNDFYITGESYGGIYVPTLAARVVKNQFPQNFKSMAIGNGFLDVLLLINSLVPFEYMHGLMDTSEWNELMDACCPNVTNERYCNFFLNPSLLCVSLAVNVFNKPFKQYLNPYNIYGDCYTNNKMIELNSETFTLRDYVYRQMDSNNLLPCEDLTYMENYLNNVTVKNALHINNKSNFWSGCAKLNYTTVYYSMMLTVKSLLDSGIKTLIYNGDIDSMCNFLGDKWFDICLTKL